MYMLAHLCDGALMYQNIVRFMRKKHKWYFESAKLNQLGTRFLR